MGTIIWRTRENGPYRSFGDFDTILKLMEGAGEMGQGL